MAASRLHEVSTWVKVLISCTCSVPPVHYMLVPADLSGPEPENEDHDLKEENGGHRKKLEK